MAIGIWTPVYGVTQTIVFPDRLNNFAAKLKQVTLPAGTHMRFTNLGCLPIFIHIVNPADDFAGFTGAPVLPHKDVVMPRQPTIWIYCPYENLTVHVDIGALT